MMINYVINRDSICMGDDISDHQIGIEMSEDATYQELFRKLKRMHYLPASSHCVWVFTNQKHFCIFSYFKELNRFNPGLVENRLAVLDDGSHLFRFRYYSPYEWKEKILAEYDNDTYSLWKDGWSEEIALCDHLIKGDEHV